MPLFEALVSSSLSVVSKSRYGGIVMDLSDAWCRVLLTWFNLIHQWFDQVFLRQPSSLALDTPRCILLFVQQI
jgi:hypothetical protein